MFNKYKILTMAPIILMIIIFSFNYYKTFEHPQNPLSLNKCVDQSLNLHQYKASQPKISPYFDSKISNEDKQFAQEKLFPLIDTPKQFAEIYFDALECGDKKIINLLTDGPITGDKEKFVNNLLRLFQFKTAQNVKTCEFNEPSIVKYTQPLIIKDTILNLELKLFQMILG